MRGLHINLSITYLVINAGAVLTVKRERNIWNIIIHCLDLQCTNHVKMIYWLSHNCKRDFAKYKITACML